MIFCYRRRTAIIGQTVVNQDFAKSASVKARVLKLLIISFIAVDWSSSLRGAFSGCASILVLDSSLQVLLAAKVFFFEPKLDSSSSR
jgi:hypothetical protein